ncbi:major facilitator superfamily domain-containing protein [Dendryphion nanum]|uniref:Major facilitator superfamily domain-containing protein n=1 Tax=Dendryphion nanum TaxID=256645 RepID=A0A9P9ECE0_9PLEO|nr:major facilitator superfamily domain-containing protein [Dendryphion nanum]
MVPPSSIESKHKSETSRRRTHIGQALVFFNVYGVPLSFGPYCEYYYNNNISLSKGNGQSTTLSLSQISVIPAAQLFGLFLAVLPSGLLYEYRIRRLAIWVAILGAAGCQGALLATERVELHALICGFQSFFLGCLGVVSTMCLATHYRNNVPLVSITCVSTGLIGAKVYTIVAYTYLANKQLKKAQYMNLGILAVSLFLGGFVIKPNDTYKMLSIVSRPCLSDMWNSKGMPLFITGFWLLYLGLFVWPTYMVLLISSAPRQTWPGEPTVALMVTYCIAFITAAIATSKYFCEGVGPVNTFIGAAVLAGGCYISPAWMPYLLVVWPSTVVYGAALGPIVVLSVKVLMVFSAGNKKSRLANVAVVLMMAGVFAAAGVVGAALLVERFELGFRWALLGTGVCMVVGGLCMGSARGIRVGKVWRIVI